MRAYDPHRNDRVRAAPFETLPAAILSSLTMLAILAAVVALVSSVSVSWEPIWPGGAQLWYFAGAVFVLNGLWCALSPATLRRVWGADRQGLGLFVATAGLAMLGGALEHDGPSEPFLVLLVPLGVAIVMVGVALHRKPATDRAEPLPAPFVLLYVVAGLPVIAIGLLDLAGRW